MRHRFFFIFSVLAMLVLGSFLVQAQVYPVSMDIQYQRQFQPADLNLSAGEILTVTISLTNNESSDLRGVYVSEQIHKNFTLNTVSVKIDGSDVTDYTFATGAEDDVYTGCIPHYWIIETAPDNPQNNPINNGSMLEIVYTISTSQNHTYYPFNRDGAFGILQGAVYDVFFAKDSQTRAISVGSPNGIETGSQNPSGIELIRAFPNPFNSLITIRVNLQTAQNISLDIYDINGKRIKTVFSGFLAGGNNDFRWNGTDFRGYRVASGMYFCTMNGLTASPKTLKFIYNR